MSDPAGGGRRGWAGRLAPLLLLAVSTALALAVAEAAVRGLDLFLEVRGRAFSVRIGAPEDVDAALLPHPYRGWMRMAEHDPGLAAFPTEWSRGERTTNLLGFRSAIFDPRELAPEDLVVAVTGGSVANGVVVYGGDAFVATLERRRPRLEGRVRLLNLASGGYKQPQQLATVMETLVLGVPLDAVVNLDGFNEVALGEANVDGGVHPFFPSALHYQSVVALSGGINAASDVAAAAEIVAVEERAEALRRAFTGTPFARSHFLQAVVGAVALRLDSRARRLEIAFQEAHGALREGLPALDAPCLAEDDPERRRAACLPLEVDVWYRASASLAALARGHGLAYVHALQPNQHLAGTKPLTAEELDRAYDPEHPWSRVYVAAYPLFAARGAELRAAGVDFHDLTPIFAEHPESLYNDRCCHLGVRGNRLLATRLAELVDAALGDAGPGDATPSSAAR